jgi:cell division septum initiation protein DivIVA
LNRAKQGDAQAASQLQFQYAQLQQQQQQFEAQNTPGFEDYLGLGANFVTGMWGKK